MMFNTILAAFLAVSAGLTATPQPGTPSGSEGVKAGVSPASKAVSDAAAFTAFKAKIVYLGNGTSLENGVVLVQDGIIVKVGKDLEIPAGAGIVDHDGALSAGLIALHSNDGAGGELNDTTRTVMPDAEARFAFDPKHPELREALEAGITSIVLCPSSSRLIGGQTAVVKTSGGVIVKPNAQLSLGLSSAALSYNEFPTSYSGALGELNAQFSDPKGAVSRAVAGSLPVLMDVNDRAETMRAIAFAKKYKLRGAMYGSYWAEDVVVAIKESGFDVICTPFDVGDNQRGARSVAALAAAGVRIGFGLDSPARHPASLRFGAAMCVRQGLAADSARKALTGDAADIVGAGNRIGKIARGSDADIVLWSGDPVALSSSIKAVYIEGKQVFGGSK